MRPVDNPENIMGCYSLNPLLTHDCLTSMERVFHAVPCNEEDKAMFATHILWGSITRWWERASTRMTTQSISKMGDRFKEVFLEKYFLDSIRAQKEYEF